MNTSLIAFLIVSFCGNSAAQQERKWEVDGLCGRIDRLEKIPDGELANTFSERRRALRGLPMALFQRRDGQGCCNDLVALERTKTGKDGRFEFKTKNPGDFWLTTDWNSKQYKVAVVNKQQRNSSAVSSQQGIDLDDTGEANGWVTITLD